MLKRFTRQSKGANSIAKLIQNKILRLQQKILCKVRERSLKTLEQTPQKLSVEYCWKVFQREQQSLLNASKKESHQEIINTYSENQSKIDMSSIRESLPDPEFGKFCDYLFNINKMTSSLSNISRNQLSQTKNSGFKEKDINISGLMQQMESENFKVLTEENI